MDPFKKHPTKLDIVIIVMAVLLMFKFCGCAHRDNPWPIKSKPQCKIYYVMGVEKVICDSKELEKSD